MAAGPIVIGVLNSSEDTVEMLRMYLELEGFIVVSAHVHAIRRGEQTIGEAIAEHKPAVIIYDVAPPYDRTWLFYEHLRALEALQGCRWVITSTNPQRLKELAPDSRDLDVWEIVGKPYDLQQVVEAVKAEVAKSAQRG
jgi:DNA-binding response OmpR family regulator